MKTYTHLNSLIAATRAAQDPKELLKFLLGEDLEGWDRESLVNEVASQLVDYGIDESLEITEVALRELVEEQLVTVVVDKLHPQVRPLVVLVTT